MKKFAAALVLVFAMMFVSGTAITAMAAENETETAAAAETEEAAAEDFTGTKAIAAGVLVMVVASVGAISMALAIRKSADSMARQPEAAGRINSAMMLGLVFIETAIIYALIVAILIIFVL